MIDIPRLINATCNSLSDDLRDAPWKGSRDPLAGHCYVASEALYYLLGGKPMMWKPMYMVYNRQPHWFLHHQFGVILDVTGSQFGTKGLLPYHTARGKGFLTKQPSKRAQILINRINKELKIRK